MLRLFVTSRGAFRCCTGFAWSVQEKLSRTVRMAGLMAYTLTEDRGVDLPDTGAWTLVETKDAERQRVCIPVLGVVARVFSLASGAASFMCALRVLGVLRGLQVRFCDCRWICLPMSYLFCALYKFYRQAGRSGRSSICIRMSRDTSMSRGTSTGR